MRIKDLKGKTGVELRAFLTDKREALRRFRFDISHSKAKNNKEAREIRKDIARALTLMKIKER